MKKYFIFILILTCINARANTYYFSSSIGDDSRSVSQAQNQSTPWKSIAKLNSIFSTLNPGDNINFMRGDLFYGAILVSKSGTLSAPISIDSYGSGARPIITGFVDVVSWINSGGNIWESSSSVTSLNTCNIISINGVNTPYGRTPDINYYTIQSATATSITDAAHINFSSIDYTGANIVSRTAAWHLDRAVITSASGSTVNFSAGMDYSPSADWGYFIQNHPSCLNLQNEWCFISSTKKVRIYNTSAPLNVKVPNIDVAISIGNFDNIKISNIDIQGYNQYGINVNGRQNISVSNCNFSFIADVAVYSFTNPGASNLSVTGCTFTDINSGAVITRASSNTVVQNNYLTNVGFLPGMAGTPSSGGDLNYTGIQVGGDNSKVLYNSIVNVGYVGIRFDGNSILIQGNFINRVGGCKDDGGGIYCFPNAGDNTHTTYIQRVVRDNIVLNAIGNPYGKPLSNQAFSEQMLIYNDGTSSNVTYKNNTMAFGRYGWFGNAGTDLIVDSNTVYIVPDPLYGIGGSHGPASAVGDIYGVWHNNYKNGIDNCSFTNNIVAVGHTNSGISCGVQNVALAVYSVPLPSTWVSSNNIYANPLDQTNTWIYSNSGSGSGCKTLSQWQSQTGKDVGSTGAPFIVSDTNKIKFVYNETNGTVTKNLGAAYKDMKGALYNGSITLNPFSSAILLYFGASNTPPTCSAGTTPVSINLPSNVVVLAASGASTSGGSISSYSWVKTSGPSATISNSSSASTNVTLTTTGTYIFTVTVTDNNGLNCTASKTVIVNPAPNQAPIANAGNDQVITLPTSSVNLSGLGTDADGTISSYSWNKIQGSGGIISSPNSQNSTFIGLSAGIYKVEFTVTDNSGAIGKDTVQITVLTAIPPVANAGSDKNITLPINFAAMNGSGSSGSGGSIVSYSWIKIPGSPSGGNISNSNSATTQANNLLVGTYSYELTVIDANGQSDTDTMQIVVNAAPVLTPPIPNAGADFIAYLPFNSISLVGSVITPSGTLAGVTWSLISGSGATITTPLSLVTTITGITTAGKYKFKLLAMDSNGLTASDTIEVTVVDILPVTGYKGFNAVLNKQKQAVISWTGVQTANSDYYSLEMKLRTTYSTVAQVKATIVGNENYKITTVAKYGMNYYRLKIVEKSGNYYYSSEVSLKKN